MGKFINRTIQFSVALFITLLALETPLQFNYDIQNADQADWHKLDSINADVLVVGNSRVWRNLDAEKITRTTQRKTYLLGQDGMDVIIMTTKLQLYLKKNKKPKLIIIQCDPGFWRHRGNWYQKENFLKYLFKDRLEIQTTFQTYSGNRWYDWSIPTIRYAGHPGRYFIDAFGKKVGPLEKVLGAVPDNSLNLAPDNTIQNARWNNFKTIDSCISDLSPFMKNQEIIYLYPPISTHYQKCLNHNPFHIDSLCVRPFYDYSSLTLPDTMFRDHTHLNGHGVPWFSSEVSRLITEHCNALQQP